MVSSSSCSYSTKTILSRIQELDATKYSSNYVGFVINSYCVGQVHRNLIPILLEHTKDIFQLLQRDNHSSDNTPNNNNAAALHLMPTLSNHEERTAALDQVTQVLIDQNIIRKRHTDLYPIRPPALSPPSNGQSSSSSQSSPKLLCLINRNAAPYFGITSVGVHLLCYEKDTSSNISLWMAQRADNKAHYPSLWDPTVAGGQPANISLWENVMKESYEEAGIPRQQLEQYFSVGGANSEEEPPPISCISQMTSKADGTCLKQSLYYVWEMQVNNNNDEKSSSTSFQPNAVDGEVQKFELWDTTTLLKEVQNGNRLRPAMRLVVTDFLIRHNIIVNKPKPAPVNNTNNNNIDDDDDDYYGKIQSALHQDRLILWEQQGEGKKN